LKCPHCQADNRSGRRFCSECGASLFTPCAACGFANEPGEKFCGGCGQSLTGGTAAARHDAPPDSYTPAHLADKILRSRSALEGERKQVTVVFADLVGSTGRAERLGPDAMHGLLNRFFEVALEAVHRYEGTVNQFLGDGFMALFGAPIAHEDHARRAVLAALALHDALGREDESLAARIGINTGPVVVGAIGDNLRMDYTAVGDTTNLAARLQQLAEPGTMLIGEVTYRAMGGIAVVEPLPPTRFKGKTEEVTPYRVLGRAAARSRLESHAERELSRFVGRDHELGALHAVLDQVSAGHGQVVGIVGDPGLGKSRLLLEFRRSLRGRGVTYAEGRCLSYGTATPYLPIIDIVRTSAGIADTDTPEAVADRLGQILADLGVAVDDGLPCLLHMLGIKEGAARATALSPETLKAKTFATLEQMAVRSSRRRPLVLAVEDLHWVDRTSESYLTTLVDALAGASVMLVATYRPGYQPPWLGKSYATQMALRPLAARDDRAILESVLRERQVAEETVERLIEKAEGNPFFLEELARTVIEHGAPSSIPDTVQDVLNARIDRLPESSKRLLQTAAVIGRHVSPRLLEAVWNEPASLATGLRDLKRLEFVYDEHRGEEPELAFKHVLTQEVAYESLVLSRRQQLHAAVGRALEHLYAGRLQEAVDRLAHHYSRAEQPGKAVEYLTRVGEKAARSFAHAEALVALEEATVQASRLPDADADRWLVELAVIKAEPLHFLGRRQESVELLLAERERLERVGDLTVSARYFFRLGYAYSFLGDRERAPASLHCALEDATRCGDLVTAGNAQSLLALEAWFSGDCRRGVEHAAEAIALLGQTEAKSALGMTYFVLSANRQGLGDLVLALEAAERAAAIAGELGDQRLMSNALMMQALARATMGDSSTAMAVAEKALTIAPDDFERAACLGMLGQIRLRSGDVKEAIATLEKAVAEADRYRSVQIRSMFHAGLAAAYLAAGRVDEASTLAKRGLDLAHEARYRAGTSGAERILGLVAKARGRADEARRYFTSALARSESMHARLEQAGYHFELAALDAAASDLGAGREHLTRAFALYRESGVTRFAPRMGELAGVLGLEPPA
jgi:class 3 adenylate cyclase/tetratricopeptide (TPR) repeat protein